MLQKVLPFDENTLAFKLYNKIFALIRLEHYTIFAIPMR